jgi:hypothetical protein
MADPLRVEGLRELQRAFKVAGKEESKLLRQSLKESAAPVQTDAEALSRINISRITRGKLDWWSMRIGVTQTSVYVAPARRRTTTRKRPNLAGLLLDEAMLPALEMNREEVVRNVDDVLTDVSNIWGRGG